MVTDGIRYVAGVEPAGVARRGDGDDFAGKVETASERVGGIVVSLGGDFDGSEGGGLEERIEKGVYGQSGELRREIGGDDRLGPGWVEASMLHRDLMIPMRRVLRRYVHLLLGLLFTSFGRLVRDMLLQLG
jgi:microsomal dipeptidase-like Zn-dependent dipeptidase